MKLTHIISAAIMFQLAACNQQADKKEDSAENTDKSSGEDIVVEETVPEDSTGAQVPVQLDVQSGSGSGLSLQGEETTTTTEETTEPAAEEKVIKVSESVTLSMARFNLWAIKVKANKDPSDKEKDLEKKEMEEETQDVAELETEASAGLKDKEEKDPMGTMKPEEKPEHMKDKVRDKIKSKRDEYQKVEEERKERDKKRDKSLKFHGPYVYDAIAGSVEGEIPPVDLNDGSYRRIEFKMKRNVTADDADPILGNVFVIQGTVKKGEETVPFEITWHSAMNFRLRGENAYKVEGEGDSKLAIAFDVAKWFDGIDLPAATAADDGTIYINKSSNKDILKQLRKNIKVNTRFGNDKDGNGKLDAAETAGQGEDTPDAE